MNFSQTLVWRHRKENLKKCSLHGLEGRDDLHFLTYPKDELPDLSHHILLTPDAPPLTAADTAPLLLVDATWRLAGVMLRKLPPMTRRSLPPFPTAYPRRQDETHGLASVEALYLAHLITGRDTDGLLKGYHWREQFLKSIFERSSLLSL